MLLALGQSEAALELARAALRLGPEDAAALEVLTRALSATGQPEEARRRAASARERASDDAQRQYLDHLAEQLGSRSASDS